MGFGAHHEWGTLREVVIGLSPAEDFVVFHEDSMRWQRPEEAEFSRKHAGRRLIELDPDWAERMERQVNTLAELVAREGVVVHRPERLQGIERTFLAPNGEGGDTLLNGYEVYVGMSGCASDMAGIDWLQALLGVRYRVIPVALRSNVLHLDCALGLVKPGLLIWCPEKLIDGLPRTLREWDAITVSKDEANKLATNGLVLEEGRMIVDADNARVIDELRQRKVDVIPLPFDGPIRTGGGLRCAHHPLWRESVLA